MTKSFTERFNFNPEKHLFVGIERECFLTRDGQIVPIAHEVISRLEGRGTFGRLYGYELSACQLEIRTDPVPLEDFPKLIESSDQRLKAVEDTFKFEALHTEVAPYNMPLDVYPDPSGRYQEITRNMPIEKLRAACRVAGTHVHIGMGSKEQAIKAYNAAIPYLQTLCSMGDKSNGERLEIYRIMAPNFVPPRYTSWECYERYATEHGFIENPRNCWHLTRISVHGTIEFRMFGATPNIQEINEWVRKCYIICANAL
jgi:gamma-glutamyl:cysteine ligase YbdK (ATP-grasp superfamily)